MLSELVLRVRHAIFRTLAEGGVPLSVTLADTLKLPLDEVRLAYTRLHDARAIVLDRWYDGRLSLDWEPRPLELSQQLLTDAGFEGKFWSLTG